METKFKQVMGQHKFFRQRRVGHEPVVRIERHSDSLVIVEFERMVFQGSDAAGLPVGREAYFQGNSMIVHELHQILVFFEPCAVPDPVCAAMMNGLMDGGNAVVRERMMRLNCTLRCYIVIQNDKALCSFTNLASSHLTFSMLACYF